MALAWFDKKLLVFALVSIGVIALLVKYANEPQLTYDSIDYISSSKSLNTYLASQNPDGHTYLYRPPLFPLYLHFFQNKILAAKSLNAVSFVLSLWLCFFIAWQLKLERAFQALAVFLVACNYPWLQNHFFVWTEPVFSVFLLLLIVMMIQKKSWILLTLVCLVLFFIRKAGVFISAGVIAVFILNREYRTAFYMGLILILVFFSWELFTSLLYTEASQSKDIFSNLSNYTRWHYADVITAWFLPRNISLTFRMLILLSGTFAFCFFYKTMLIQWIAKTEIKSMLILIAVYLSFFFLFLGAPEYNEAERYLSVMLPLVSLLMISLVQLIYSQRERRSNYILIALAVWSVYPIGRTIAHLLELN